MISLQKVKQLCPLIRNTTSARYSAVVSTEKSSENDQIKPQVFNRNPRNLERLRIAWKPQGYNLENPGRSFWHKLVLVQSGRHISAQVVHYTGNVVVEASTNEWSLRKHLYNSKDKSAYTNLAKVFARRCLESGIIEMENGLKSADPNTKVGNFALIVEEEGISLKEPSRYKHAYPFHHLRPEKPWVVTED